MPKIAANLDWLYTDLPYSERFAAAAAAGFKAVELQFPYVLEIPAVVALKEKYGLHVALINMPAGDWAKGERGMAAIPDRAADFRASLDKGFAYAEALKAGAVHLMAGLVPNTDITRGTYAANVGLAARRAREIGTKVSLEPINSRDMPTYFLKTLDQAAAVMDEVGSPDVILQFDAYHTQITHGDLVKNFEKYLPKIGHVQIAGVPTRNEPSVGEVNYPYLFEAIDKLGFEGWVGCEYRPAGDTNAGLGWAAPYGIKPPTA